MTKILLYVLFVLFPLGAWSQIRVVRDENGKMITEVVNRRTLNVSSYRGSIFLKDSVMSGIFAVGGGEKLEKPVLFDVLHQHFIMSQEADATVIKNTDIQLSHISFKSIQGAYFEIRHDTRVKLLLKYSCSLRDYPRNYNGTALTFENGFTGEVVHKRDYFLLFPDNSLRAVDLNKKSVSNALTKNGGGVKYAIQKWGKKISTEEDITALLSYLDAEGVL